MIKIVPVTSSGLVRQFVGLPYLLYARDRHWVPPLKRDEFRRFNPKHNPFLRHAEIKLWLARRDGRPAGRIAAIDDRLHDEFHGQRTAWFGFFEARDPETARALLEEVEDWGRRRRAAVVRGPANPSLNESAGLLIEGFNRDPYVLMPYNPPEYADFVAASGYRKAKDLLAWEIDLEVPLGDRIARVAERMERSGDIRVRTMNFRHFDRDLAAMQAIYRAAWTSNWGFVPPTDDEIRQLAIDLKPVLDPELVLFAELDGREVGCAVAIPDVNQVLKRMRGRLFPTGVLHFLRRRSIIDQARVLLLGVMPDTRRLGLYPLLIAEIHRRGVQQGYRRAELSWTLEDNDAINAGIEAAGGRRYKVYRLYDKPLG